MREILFRGKRLDNGEWVEGAFIGKYDPLLCISYAFIVAQKPKDSFVMWYAVDPSTVGQYTGLCDKNGKKIFEGDIVRSIWNEAKLVLFCTENVASCGCCFPAFEGSGFKAEGLNLKDCWVIGNIHDNPELLKGE